MEDVRNLLMRAFNLALKNGVLINSVEFEVEHYQNGSYKSLARAKNIKIDCEFPEQDLFDRNAL